MTISIPITPPMITVAKKVEQHFKTRFKHGGNYTGLESDKRFYHGILGELAFYQLLKDNGKKAEFEHDFEKPDGGDLTVWVDDLGVKIDVKTSSAATHKYLMMPTAQLKKYHCDSYVGVRINGDVAEIMGYCYAGDLKPLSGLGLKVLTTGILFKELRSIDNMLAKMISGKAVAKLPVDMMSDLFPQVQEHLL